MKRRAQAGVELLMYVSFSMLLFSGFYFGVLKKDINAANSQEALAAGDLSERIALEIRLAKSTGDGYTRNFTLKNDVQGTAYSVRLASDMVLLDVGDRTYAAYAAASNISGSILPGCNTISNVRSNVSVKAC